MKLIVSLLLVLLAPVELARGMIDMENVQRTHALFLLAATVAMEAEGEDYLGKLAVAHVIMNRVRNGDRYSGSISDVIFKPYHFSAWNTKGGRQLVIDNIGFLAWWESEKAAAAAYYKIGEDPTYGADHYLNVELTKKIRKDKRLPRWVSKMTKTVKIDKHTFYKEGR